MMNFFGFAEGDGMVRRRMKSECNRRSFDYALRAPLRMTLLKSFATTVELRSISHPCDETAWMGHPAAWVTRVVAGLMMVGLTSTAGAQGSSVTSLRKKLIPSNTNVAASSLGSYLARVKADNQSIQPTAGAIWTDSGRLVQLTSDVRAMRPHDLIAVVVQESLAASTDGTVKNQRSSAANSAITGLLGTVKTSSALSNLLAQTSSN
jgi:hypothetical protein